MIKQKTDIENKFVDLLQNAMNEFELDLYDLEFVPGSCTLTVFIIDPKTNTAVIEDCVQVDRALTEPFEELSWIPEDIVLEVSSPGAYRNINTKDHFELAKEQRVKLKLYKFLDESVSNLPASIGKNHLLVGFIQAVNDEDIIIKIDNEDVKISFENIKKANLEPEFS